MLPVHLACRNGASKGVVLTLLASFPESIHVRDRKGRSPTDLVMTSSSQNKEAVLYALKRFRRDSMDDEAVDYPTNKMAVKTTMLESTKSKKKLSSPLPVVATIQKVTSPVAKEVDYEHRTVLFRLILKKEWTAAVTRAQAFPEEASTWIVTKGFNGNLRFLPLHKACVLQPPVSVIHALLEAYPKGCAEADQDEWLPLHCAAFYGTNDEVINALLNAYPKGAQIKDSDDRLPLHYACLKGASLGVVQTLLESFPKGTMSKDNEGRLPLHQAAGKNAPDDVIDALLKACPKAAQSKDDTSRLALHHACRKNASERTVRTLIKVYPRAAQIKDDQDKLPIHYACQHATVTSDKVVALLLATHPESVNVQNGFGYTPLAEIKAHDNPKLEHVVRRLEKTKRDQDKKKTVNENGAVEGQVALLQDRVRDLERSMAKIASLGREVQKDLLKKNKTPADIIEKFADRLVEIGTKGSGGGGATPLKVRQATPSKGLFNRVSKGIMSNGKM
jgi:ankyrin repeat protein